MTPRPQVRRPLRAGPDRAEDDAEPLLPGRALLGAGSEQPGFQACFRAMKAEGGWGAVSHRVLLDRARSDDSTGSSARLWDDGDVRNLGLMCDTVHEHGALAGVELWHGGRRRARRSRRRSPAAACPDREPVRVPAAAARRWTSDDIREVQQLLRRRRQARPRRGLRHRSRLLRQGDCLPHQFLMPFFNKRTDEYGGSFENRARFTRRGPRAGSRGGRRRLRDLGPLRVDTLDEPHGLGDRASRGRRGRAVHRARATTSSTSGTSTSATRSVGRGRRRRRARTREPRSRRTSATSSGTRASRSSTSAGSRTPTRWSRRSAAASATSSAPPARRSPTRSCRRRSRRGGSTTSASASAATCASRAGSSAARRSSARRTRRPARSTGAAGTRSGSRRPRTPTTTCWSSAPARPAWSARSCSASAACAASTSSTPRRDRRHHALDAAAARARRVGPRRRLPPGPARQAPNVELILGTRAHGGGRARVRRRDRRRRDRVALGRRRAQRRHPGADSRRRCVAAARAHARAGDARRQAGAAIASSSTTPTATSWASALAEMLAREGTRSPTSRRTTASPRTRTDARVAAAQPRLRELGVERRHRPLLAASSPDEAPLADSGTRRGRSRPTRVVLVTQRRRGRRPLPRARERSGRTRRGRHHGALPDR